MSINPRLSLVLLLLAAVARPAFAADAPAPAAQTVPCCIQAGDYDGDGVQDRLDKCNNTPKGCIIDAYGCSTDADGDGVCDGIDQCPDTPKGVKVNKVGCSADQLAPAPPAPAPHVAPPPPPAPAPAPPPPPAPAPSAVEKQLVETGSITLRNVYFDLGKATLLPESEAILNEAGAALAKYPDLKVEIQGHTDSRGSAVYNQNLSQRRASAVRGYLLSHFKLTATNMTAKGYGESQLLVSPEQSDADFQQNRRVVLKAVNPEVLPGNIKLEQNKH